MQIFELVIRAHSWEHRRVEFPGSDHQIKLIQHRHKVRGLDRGLCARAKLHSAGLNESLIASNAGPITGRFSDLAAPKTVRPRFPFPRHGN